MIVGVLAVWLTGCESRRSIAPDARAITLSVQVTWPAAFDAAATRLGWTRGIPAARVVIVRQSEPVTPPETLVTDGNGEAIARAVLPGEYRIEGSRTLSTAEATRVRDLTSEAVLVGTLKATLGEDGDETAAKAALRLAPVDRGSLLFSEMAPLTQEDITRGVSYSFSNYVRVYNNSDTSVTLAGKLFFEGFPNWWDFSSANPDNNCTTLGPLMRDPQGIWAGRIYQFPPTAGILRPGQTALLVTDAIDHRAVAPGMAGLYDFTAADFEFIGLTDVDNPSVPNIPSVGPIITDPMGHGWRSFHTSPIFGLAVEQDLGSLERRYNAFWAAGSTHWRIPNAAILDVLSVGRITPIAFPACPPSVLPETDAEIAMLLPESGPFSLQRKVARKLPDGRAILQKTRNSAADWILAPMTPFRVP